MSDERVVITRRGSELGTGTAERTVDKRVYVTGPHFGGDIFSSTLDPSQASTFDRATAERYLRQGKWQNNEPQIEPVPLVLSSGGEEGERG